MFSDANNKKRKARHVLKFRDFEIDEDDYHVVERMLREMAKSSGVDLVSSTADAIKDGRIIEVDKESSERRAIHFRGNDIRILPTSIAKLEELRSLSIYGSSIRSLPTTIQDLSKLEGIYLNGCLELSSLPFEIGTLWNLKYLEVINCRNVRTLPDSIGRLRNLERLRVNIGRLRGLPNTIGYLSKLTELDLGIGDSYRGNSLTFYVSDLIHLEKLTVPFSALKEFPVEFFANPNIMVKDLYLIWDLAEGSPTASVDFERTVGKMTSLESLFVTSSDSDDHVEDMSPPFPVQKLLLMTKLKEVYFSGTSMIVDLRGLQGHPSLETLELEHSTLSSAPFADPPTSKPSVPKLENLTILYATGTLDFASIELPSLRSLVTEHGPDLVFSNDGNDFIPFDLLSSSSPKLERVIINYDPDNSGKVFSLFLDALAKLPSVEFVILDGLSLCNARGKQHGRIRFEKLKIACMSRCVGLFSEVDLSHLECPMLEDFSYKCWPDLLIQSERLEALFTDFFARCPKLLQVCFFTGKISALSESAFAALPRNIRALDLSFNPIVSEINRQACLSELLLKFLPTFHQLGYFGQLQTFKDTSQMKRIAHLMSINRARSRVLLNQPIRTPGLWSLILENAPKAFVGRYAKTNPWAGITEDCDAIFHLLCQRGVQDLFAPTDQ